MDVMELEARFLGEENGQIRLFFMDAQVRKTLVTTQEFKNEWQNATVGQHIMVRVKNEYVDANGLLASKSYKPAKEQAGTDDKRPRPH